MQLRGPEGLGNRGGTWKVLRGCSLARRVMTKIFKTNTKGTRRVIKDLAHGRSYTHLRGG